MELNSDLKIDLSIIQPGLISQKNICGAPRERVTGEKYFRQIIQVYNKEGKLVDSGFVKINDYTDMCRMVRVCNTFKKQYHLFEDWQHYGKDFYKTSKFKLTDLVTGNIITRIESIHIDSFIEKTKSQSLCIVGDLVKDEYSEVLLECLDEYSKSNEPQNIKYFRNIVIKDEKCGCNLFQYLDINDSFKNEEINEKTQELLLNSLVCHCKNNLLEKVLTEEQKVVRAELKLKAQAEIEQVLSIKELETDVANMV